MPIRTILQGDIPALRMKSTHVTTFDSDLTTLLTDLTDTITHHRGLGLSGPQIGTPSRVMIVDDGNGLREFINPEILQTSGQVEGYESCLSFPEHTLKITRPSEIIIQANDRYGDVFQVTARDLFARIICHEVDHLDGILFMDHLPESDMFLHFLEQLEVVDDVASDDMEDVDEQLLARCEELQFLIDMLAEVSWKLTLSSQMLEDYQDTIPEQAQATQTLDRSTSELETLIEHLEAALVRLESQM